MNVEPQELPAEALAMLVENPGSSLVAQLLQHVAHQEQAIVKLRTRIDELTALKNQLQLEQDTALARVAELESVLREVRAITPYHDRDEEIDCRCRRCAAVASIDQALASAGGEKATFSKEWCIEMARREEGESVAAGVLAMDPCTCDDRRPGQTHDVDCPHTRSGPKPADPSPGASERRTLYAVEYFLPGESRLWLETGDRCHELADAQETLERDRRHSDPTCLLRIVRVTEIRDVIAAGEKEGGSK